MSPTHPLVIHWQEEYGSEAQPILMRGLSTHLTAVDRQIQESLNIILETRKPGQCLNLKSEWAGAKIPGLQVSAPKGISKGRKENKEGQDNQQEDQENLVPGDGGIKRLRKADIQQEKETEQDVKEEGNEEMRPTKTSSQNIA